MLTAGKARVLSEEGRYERIDSVIAFIRSRALDGSNTAKFEANRFGGVLIEELKNLGYTVEIHGKTVIVEW